MVSPNDFRHFTAFVNGINLHYVEEGSGDRVVVLCHGWPDLWFGWRHQIKPIAAAGFRVIVPDLRGFGQTDAPKDTSLYAMKNLTQDLAALLDHLGIGKAIFLGHDWGGEVVWKMCLFHPERVIAVGAICTPFTPRHEKFIPIEEIVKLLPAFQYQIFLTSPEAPIILGKDPEKFFRVMFRTSDSDDSVGPFMKNLNEIGDLNPPRSKLLTQEELDYYAQQYKKRGFEGGLNYYKTRKLNWELEEQLNLPRTISHKALMVTAGKDGVLSPKMAAGMVKTVPNLTMKEVPNAGHWILSERTKEVNEIILSWLATLNQNSKL